MTADTRAQVIGQILKLNKEFKPRHVYEPIGISRQLCYNYLNTFLDKGLISKLHNYYVVENKEALIDEMLVAPSRRKVVYPDSPLLKNFITKADVDGIIKAKQSGGDPTAWTETMNSITELQEALKQLKVYLGRKQFPPSTLKPKSNAHVLEHKYSDAEGWYCEKCARISTTRENIIAYHESNNIPYTLKEK